jgi:hypothetical protein
VIAHRQLGVAIAVAAAALGVLLVVHSAPVLDTSHDRPRVPFAVAAARPLPVHGYEVWVDANDRFAAAAHAFGKALGGCRMRLGSFGACALPVATAMAYEERHAAAVAATYGNRSGGCSGALQIYRGRLVHYMAAAMALADLPHGNPMSALGRLEGSLQTAHVGWNEASLRVRGDCRPG